MTVSSKTLRLLHELGVTGDALVTLVESIEQDIQPAVSKGAERQRRYREKQKALRGDANGDVTRDVLNIPPLDKEKVRQKETNLPPKEKTPKGVKKKIPHAKKLPDWVDQTEWQAFVEMRKAIKAPLTEGAIKRTIDDLERLKSQGHDPTLCLRQSVQRSYRGVFAPKSDWKDSNKQADGNKNGNKNIAELTPEQLYAEYH